MKRRRTLRAEERLLWQHVARGVAPLQPKTAPIVASGIAARHAEKAGSLGKDDRNRAGTCPDTSGPGAGAVSSPGTLPAGPGPHRPALASHPSETALWPPPELPALMTAAGRVSIDLAPGRQELLARPHGAAQRKVMGRLRRGKMQPQARLDLHGLDQEAAHRVLRGFVLGSQRQGLRLLLVITGKGRGPAMPGVLRAQVPRWLALPPLASAVLHLSEAHVSHGGGGALYIWLRRQR